MSDDAPLLFDAASFDWATHEALIESNGITLDRPRYSSHPDYPEIIYPLDYGYINDTVGMDEMEIDVFVGSVPSGLVGVILSTDHRKGDQELKLLYNCSAPEVYLAHGFINFAPELMSGILYLRQPMHQLWAALPPADFPLS